MRISSKKSDCRWILTVENGTLRDSAQRYYKLFKNKKLQRPFVPLKLKCRN